MAKIICQNCFSIVGNKEQDEFGKAFVKSEVTAGAIAQPIDAEHKLVTLCCPTCNCLVQVKI